MTNAALKLCAATAALMIALLLTPPRPAAAQTAMTHPQPGSALRKNLLDLLRPTVERSAHQKVIFKVNTLNVQNGWAFVNVNAMQKNGAPLDFKKAGLESGESDNGGAALFHKTAGGWRLVTSVFWVTDVEYEDWPAKYHAPAAIIGYGGAN